MYDDHGQELFGHDGRHNPPLTILLPARFSYEFANQNRDHDGVRSKRLAELQPFAELFDCPTAIGGDYLFMNGGWRYLLPTWRHGAIEIDIFRENYLLLPEDNHRREVYEILNQAGYYYQIIGEKEFINIKREINVV